MASSVQVARVALLLLAVGLCGAGCGRRTILAADADSDGEARDGGVTLPACGRNRRPCDPNNLGGKTCESLGLQGGELSCNASTCNLDLSGCIGFGSYGTSGTGPRGGGGGGGTPGLFGTAGTPTTGGLFGTGASGSGSGNTGFFGGGGSTGFFGGGNADGGTGFFGGGNADGGTFFGGGFFGGQQPGDAGAPE